MSKVQRVFFGVAGLLVALGLLLSACRVIVEPPPLPRAIAPVLGPDRTNRADTMDRVTP